MSAIYQITAECAYATVDTMSGRTKVLLMKGALLPASTPELKHLIEGGMVAKVGGDNETGINALGGLGIAESDQGAAGSVVSSTPEAAPPAVAVDGPQVGPVTPDDPAATTGPAKPEPTEEELEARREAARAKLPADGSAPHANSSHDVWVEYAAAKGMDRAEAEKADKKDLVAALKS